VLARQHPLELELVERLLDRRGLPFRLARGVGVSRLLGEVEQDLGVGERADLRVIGRDLVLELLLLLEDALRLLRVVPEGRARRQRVELLDLQALAIDVKDAPGARRPWSTAPSGTCGSRWYRLRRLP
jgi:hypothetical protein